MALTYDQGYPARPVLPDAPSEDEQAEYDAALVAYTRNLRILDVARAISRNLFPDVEAPNITGRPWPRELRIADAALTLADDYAPDAPETLRDEAAIRAAGWIRDNDPALSSRAMSTDAGSDTVTFRASTAGSALRASGGTGLLARYVTRRAV